MLSSLPSLFCRVYTIDGISLLRLETAFNYIMKAESMYYRGLFLFTIHFPGDPRNTEQVNLNHSAFCRSNMILPVSRLENCGIGMIFSMAD